MTFTETLSATSEVTLSINLRTCDNLVKIAFQELRHAFLAKGGYDFLTEVFLAIYVEGGTDIGYFFGEEGELVFLLAVDVGERSALYSLTIGKVVDA